MNKNVHILADDLDVDLFKINKNIRIFILINYKINENLKN